jgi:uncharacterized membrane protein
MSAATIINNNNIIIIIYINIIIQITAGAISGNIFAKITSFTLDPIGNTIVGAGGGALGGQILQVLGA